MNKVIALVMAMFMVISFAACGSASTVASTSVAASESTSKSAANPYIGFTIFDYSNNFVGYIRNGVDYYITKELNGVEYLMVDGENSQATQTERIDTMISRGVNVLAVNLVDTTAGETITAKAKEANIPVVFFNRMPSKEVMASYDKCWYVGLDAFHEGELQGQMVAEAWEKDKAKWDVNGDGVLEFVLCKGTPGHSDAEDRANGFYSALEKSGIPAKELANEYANWSSTDAKEIMETWIGKYGNQIEMAVCSNDAMALGAVEALRGNDLINDKSYVPVIGVNALPEVAELIKSGVMLGSVLTSTYDAARATVDLCVNAANGAVGTAVVEGTEWELEDSKIVRIPETKITVDNVDTAIAAYKTSK